MAVGTAPAAMVATAADASETGINGDDDGDHHANDDADRGHDGTRPARTHAKLKQSNGNDDHDDGVHAY